MGAKGESNTGSDDAARGRAELLRKRQTLLNELTAVERDIVTLNRDVYATPSGGRPLRGQVLDALDDLRWPAFTREVATYISARYGRSIAPTRFGTLIADEANAYVNRGRKSRPRTVWLVPTLTSTHTEPIKRLIARSDWPLERRIVAPTTGRIQYLKVTMRLCEIALEVGDGAADAQMLKIIAADHARDLPGIAFKRGTFPLKEWRDLAAKLLADLEPRDEEDRKRAAERFALELGEQHQLFGLPEVNLGPDAARVVG